MSTSSELSNALNPHILTRNVVNHTAQPHQQPTTIQPLVHNVSHRNELELAVSEPPTIPPPRKRVPPSPEGVQAVQELLRLLAAARESQEIERKRRLAWEQEQEAKFTQRQAEMERRLFEMQQEINSLRLTVNGQQPPLSSGLLTPRFSSSPSIIVQPTPQSRLINDFTRQGVHASQSPHPSTSYVNSPQMAPYIPAPPVHDNLNLMMVEPPTPSSFGSASRSSSLLEPTPRPESSRKRPSPATSSDEESSSSDSSVRRNKRTSHHDKRCLTIQHAMRAHILRLMQLESDKQLPDNHTEGAVLNADEPVRFVWDKTPKQSVHNGRMKARILSDLKANRRMYKYVPEKEFGKKTLDSAFDQAFVTLRQKYKNQKDAMAALNYKKKEDLKATKVRRLARRKTKLSNRADARMKLVTFEHITFDGALQLECMSSEESEFDFDDGSSAFTRSDNLLRTRGLPWRSSRLIRFYTALDDEERADKITKPKRGVGKKERVVGPLKEGFFLPPKGIASWMVSRRWLDSAKILHPDLPEVLKSLVVDPPDFDWDEFHLLGDESGDEDDLPLPLVGSVGIEMMDAAYMHGCDVPTSAPSSSLQYALSIPTG